MVDDLECSSSTSLLRTHRVLLSLCDFASDVEQYVDVIVNTTDMISGAK